VVRPRLQRNLKRVLGLLAFVLTLHAPCPQLLVVDAPSRMSTHATIRFEECSKTVLGPWQARVGRNGLSAHRHEGDGTTPLGTFGVGSTVYGVSANPGVRLAYHRLVCGDWWDGDSSSPSYNTFRHIECGARLGGGSEALWRQPTAYRHFAVIGFNDSPTVPGRGSAIFLHADTGSATNGCVSVRLPQLVTILRRLQPGARIRIAVR
jgi:L,D-peptidoglycan transpeptidase YkuD (ErfK/YbiS/YcfS/YnhG family)